MISAARSILWSRALPESDNASSKASAAVRTWQIVTPLPPFFPPQPQALSGEEQVTDLREQEMA